MADPTPKRGKKAAGAEIKTGSPAGHEELEQHSISESKGDAFVPAVTDRKRNPPVHHVDMPPDRNPKHTGRSPRTKN